MTREEEIELRYKRVSEQVANDKEALEMLVKMKREELEELKNHRHKKRI